MNQYISGVLVTATLVAIGSFPSPSHALSCLDPQSMIEYYVNEDSYQVFTATAGETKEYVSQKASTDNDPNFQYDSGYTGQYVAVTKAHKGYVDQKFWVYYEKNGTWGYLCAGGPAEVGAETLYIVSQNGGVFELPRVVNSYPADSALAKDILAALDTANTEGGVSEVSQEDWQNRLRDQINEMFFMIKIKLSELSWWVK